MSTRMRLFAAVAIVVAVAWPVRAPAQGAANVARDTYASEYMYGSDYGQWGFWSVRVEATTRMSTKAPTVTFSYFEMEDATFESRWIECSLDPADLKIAGNVSGRKFATVNVTLRLSDCAIVLGAWNEDVMEVAVRFESDGQYTNQFQGQGRGDWLGKVYRFQETHDSCSAQLAGLLGTLSLTSSSGYMSSFSRSAFQRER
jgi:hypothetical protein